MVFVSKSLRGQLPELYTPMLQMTASNCAVLRPPRHLQDGKNAMSASYIHLFCRAVRRKNWHNSA
jgi:hypothetical protein